MSFDDAAHATLAIGCGFGYLAQGEEFGLKVLQGAELSVDSSDFSLYHGGDMTAGQLSGIPQEQYVPNLSER